MNIWDSYDDEDKEPQCEYFDRVIQTTDEAVLYGYKERMFWLPKSIHRIETNPEKDNPGTVLVEHWAHIKMQKDENYLKSEN
jgi:hypothetical protein